MNEEDQPSYEDILIALKREKLARIESERVLQTKTRALYEANIALQASNENLLKHQRIAIENEKMAALGGLIAGLAHEVNNPLGFVMGNLQVLRQYFNIQLEIIQQMKLEFSYFDDQHTSAIIQKTLPRKDLLYIVKDSKNLLDETEAGLNRVKDIVLSLKNFSRKDDSVRILYDVNQCIKSAITILTNELKSVNSVVIDLADIPKMYCNPNSVTQVFINILSNSIFAMKDINEKELSIESKLKDEKIQLVFFDNGCGISEENIKKIFDPFFTTKPFGQGTGLGLSICFEKIQELRGNIDVSSEPNKGCKITISLPIDSRKASRLSAQSTPREKET